MKVLKMNIYFKLPDDFDGGYPEAVRALADYSCSTIEKKKRVVKKSSKNIWESFLKVIEEGYKVAGNVFVGEHVDGKWVKTSLKEDTDDS